MTAANRFDERARRTGPANGTGKRVAGAKEYGESRRQPDESEPADRGLSEIRKSEAKGQDQS
jgi:hypothetical protein